MDDFIQTIIQEDLNENFVCFDCLGEPDVKRNEISPNGFYKCDNNKYVNDSKMCQISYLFGLEFDKGSVLLHRMDELFKMARKEIMVITSAAKLNTNTLGLNLNRTYATQNSYFISRKYCVELFIFIQNFIDSLTNDPNYYWILSIFIPELIIKLTNIRRLMGKLTDLPDHVFLHGCHSSGNKSSQPAYHLLHLHLDLRWLYLSIILKIQNAQNYIQNDTESQHYNNDESISFEINNLLFELIDLSIKRYEKIQESDIDKKSPFSCTCVQELWIMLQIFADTTIINGKDKKFWDYYNECILNFKWDITSNNARTVFSLWLLSNVAKLYQIRENDIQSNYTLLENLIKTFVSTEPREADLRTCLIFIEIMCIKIWEPKVEPLLMLWDYYHNKLNSNFHIGPSLMTSIINNTSSGLVTQIRSYIQHKQNVTDSFKHFLRLIGLHLKRSKGSPRHWNVIKGRIFSKISPQKLSSLTPIGEYNIISLFIILAISNGVTQVENKIIEIFNIIRKTKGIVSTNLLQGMFSFILLKIENNENSGQIIQNIMDYINILSSLDNYDTIRLYANEIDGVLKSSPNLNLGQHLLIGNWLSKYLSSASQNDSNRLLETLINLSNRLRLTICQNNQDHELIMLVEKLWNELILYIKDIPHQLASQISFLAASLASLSILTKNIDRFNEIFNSFMSNESNDVRIIRKFLDKLIERSEILKILPTHNNVIIKTWIRCCLLCSDINHKEMTNLTQYVNEIPEIKLITSNLNDGEPLNLFFMSLNNKYNSINVYERQSLREKISHYFDGIDKSIKTLITSGKDYDQISHVYQSLGNMFELISPLIYVKSKPNTILQQVLDLLFLPISVRNPDSKLPQNIMNCVNSTLHLYIYGLFKLSPDQDMFISRMIKELIYIYIPRCMIHKNNSNLPFLLLTEFNCFEEKNQLFILETVCSNFLRRKSKNPHNQAYLALSFINDVFIMNKEYPQLTENVLKSTFNRTCDIYMFCDSGNALHLLAVNVLKIFLNSSHIQGTSMDNVVQTLIMLGNEHLAWCSRQFFELIIFLSSQAPNLTVRFLPHLLDIIKDVEKKRGVGYDKTLRIGYEKVETCIRAIKSENV